MEILSKIVNEGEENGMKPPEEGGFFDADEKAVGGRIEELELECVAGKKKLEEMRGKLLSAEIGRRAALMGIMPERVRHITRLAVLDDVFDGEGELDGDAVGAAIEVVLSEIPELRGAKAGGGAFNPRGAALLSKTETYRRQISDAGAKGDLLSVVSLKRKARKLGIPV